MSKICENDKRNVAIIIAETEKAIVNERFHERDFISAVRNQKIHIKRADGINGFVGMIFVVPAGSYWFNVQIGWYDVGYNEPEYEYGVKVTKRWYNPDLCWRDVSYKTL